MGLLGMQWIHCFRLEESSYEDHNILFGFILRVLLMWFVIPCFMLLWERGVLDLLGIHGPIARVGVSLSPELLWDIDVVRTDLDWMNVSVWVLFTLCNNCERERIYWRGKLIIVRGQDSLAVHRWRSIFGEYLGECFLFSLSHTHTRARARAHISNCSRHW